MLSDIKKLGKETMAYGLSTMVARLLNFLLLPFYTHLLVPAEYGVVTTVFVYIGMLNILFQYGMDQAYLRYAADKSSGGVERVFTTAFLPVLATSALFSGAIFFWARPLAVLGGVGAESAQLIRYSACILALDAVTIVPFAELRLSHRVWTFVGIRSFNIVLNVAMNIYLLAGLHFGMRGVFLAALFASAANLVLLTPVLAQRLRMVFSSALLPDLLRFGLPLIPAGIGTMMVELIDRPILLYLTSEATVGIFQANRKLGIFMLLFVNMFDQAWRPFFLERFEKPDAPRTFARIFTYFLVVGTAIVLSLSFFIGELVAIPIGSRTLIHPDYWGGLGIVPVILTAHLFRGGYVNFIASVTIKKRMDLLPWITGLGAATCVLANLLLIPAFGMMGAAWATLLSYAVMAGTLFAVGQRLWPVPYEYGRILRIAAAGAAVAALVRAGSGIAGASPAGWASLRAGGLVLFPVLLLLSGFLTPGEKSRLMKLLGSRRRA